MSGAPGLVVLMYHRVAPDAAGKLALLTMPPDRFAWQMAHLKAAGFTPLRQRDVAAWLSGSAGLPERPVVITFDDGYADNTVHAFPVLERLGIPAVTFLVTRMLGGMNEWDADKPPPRRLMAGADVVQWAARGLEFGAHGRTHRSLAGLDAAALRAEIDGSHADLQELLGAPPLAFAYPFGDVDTAACEAVGRLFAVAYGTREGINRCNTSRWDLRRTNVLPVDPHFEFRCQLRLGWGPLNRVRAVAVDLYRSLRGA